MSVLPEYRYLIDTYTKDSKDLEANFALARFYDLQGHNAGAASFYIRVAELGYLDNPLLAYESLLRLGSVIGRQSHRFFSARGSFVKAIALLPERPEGYFLLSRFYEQAKEYEDAYFVASMGLKNSRKSKNLDPLRFDVEYPGRYGLVFEKAVAAWWVGHKDEAEILLLELNDDPTLDASHRQAVNNNLKMLGLEHRIKTFDFSSAVPGGTLCFDIGANVGEATVQALEAGYRRVVALEPAPIVFEKLRDNFKYDNRVVPLKLAASNSSGETVEFYECVEDGLSTLDRNWLTAAGSRYGGKPFSVISAETIKIDKLVKLYGVPDLVKIDVEGAEEQVIKGMSCKPKNLAFEWHEEHLDICYRILNRLRKKNGYTQYALQYITHHMHAPREYRPLVGLKMSDLLGWHNEMRGAWEAGGWIDAGGLRPTSDAGMIWVR